jgi:hypothetical protein
MGRSIDYRSKPKNCAYVSEYSSSKSSKEVMFFCIFHDKLSSYATADSHFLLDVAAYACLSLVAKEYLLSIHICMQTISKMVFARNKQTMNESSKDHGASRTCFLRHLQYTVQYTCLRPLTTVQYCTSNRSQMSETNHKCLRKVKYVENRLYDFFSPGKNNY